MREKKQSIGCIMFHVIVDVDVDVDIDIFDDAVIVFANLQQ